MATPPSSTYRSLVLAALAIWFVLSSGSAWAHNVADEAELHFELGAEAYQNGNYREAAEHFLASNRLSPNQNVTFNVARSYEKLGRFAEAYRYYQLADTPAARASLGELAEHVVVLEVTTEPPGATLYIDRIELGARGESPQKLGLPPGKYRIIAQKAGYADASIDLEDLAIGAHKEVTLNLVALLGRVAVSGTQMKGATVEATVGETKSKCTAPCTLELPPGNAHLIARRVGYRTAETLVVVEPEKTTTAMFRLEQSTGVVSVEADESGALVQVDGEPAGYTPALLRVPVGPHTIRVSFPGSEPVERKVAISEEKPERVTVDLLRTDTVVAASRRSERTVDAPSSVTVIPKEELRLFAYPTVLEAVRGSPGVFQWDDRAYPTLGIRGQGRIGSYGNRILLLLDDHAMNDSWAGSSYAGYQHRTDLSDVERIEIVRGPGSVLYGTNAFAGVVNVVTRKPKPNTESEVGASVVQDGMGRVRGRQDIRFDKNTALWISAAYGKSAGNSYAFVDLNGDRVTTSPEFDGIETTTGQVKFVHRALTVTGFATTADKGTSLGYYGVNFEDHQSHNQDTRGFAEVRFEPSITDDLDSHTILSGDLYTYTGGFPRETVDGGLEEDRFKGYWAGLEQRFVYSPIQLLSFTLGGVGQYHFRADQTVEYDGETSLDERRTVVVGAGYGVAELILERLRVSAGARFDAYGTNPRDCTDCTRGTFGSSLNPRFAVIGTPYQRGTTKVLVGKAFRAPSVIELFYNDGGFSQRASPDLSPEALWSLELQHIHQFTSDVQGSVSAYVTRTTGQVVDAAETPSDPYHYVNSPVPLATAGVEARLRRDWAQGWMLEGSYSLTEAAYLESEDLADLVVFERSPDFQEVANVPRHMFAVKAAAPIIKRALTLGNRLTAETGRFTWQETPDSGEQEETSPFVLWDIVLSGEERSTGVAYSFGVYNAFNTRYSLPVGSEFNMPTVRQLRRTFLADVSVRF